MSEILDEIDLRLLRCLQEDASISMDELAGRANLSRNACWRRVKRMEERGAIRGRVALVDPEKLGVGTLVLANVKLSAHGRANLEKFIESIKRLPNVLECFILMGEQDFFLKIAVRDIYEYERFFFKELSAIEGVAEVKSSMTLSQIKNETAYPIA